MNVLHLMPGRCYIIKLRNGAHIYEIKKVSTTEMGQVLVEYKRMVNFTLDLSSFAYEQDFHCYFHTEEDGFELCDVSVLDKAVKLFDLFRASARPLIKQAMKQP